MVEKVKPMEKHFEIVSQINLNMESLQAKIEELDKLRNMEKNVPSSLPIVNIMTSSYTLWLLMNVKN